MRYNSEKKTPFQFFPVWYGWGLTEDLSGLPIRLHRDDFIEFHVLTLNPFSKNKKKTSKKKTWKIKMLQVAFKRTAIFACCRWLYSTVTEQ